MNPLYFEDCYLKEWESIVEKSKGDKVILKETAFYPEGGGQPTDKGYLYSNGEEYRVKKVTKKGGGVWHHLNKEGLKQGNEIKAKLDWDRRYNHMRMHSAQHLLSAIILDEYDAATAGNQIHSDHSRIDFHPFDPSKEDIQFLIQRFNELVEEGLEVKKYIVNREKVDEIVHNPKRLRLFKRVPDFVKKIRIVEIEGVDIAPCAGTHVNNTEEIGKINIQEIVNKGKNTARIVFELL